MCYLLWQKTKTYISSDSNFTPPNWQYNFFYPEMELINIENYHVMHWRGNLDDTGMLLQYAADSIPYKPFEYHRYQPKPQLQITLLIILKT